MRVASAEAHQSCVGVAVAQQRMGSVFRAMTFYHAGIWVIRSLQALWSTQSCNDFGDQKLDSCLLVAAGIYLLYRPELFSA